MEDKNEGRPTDQPSDSAQAERPFNEYAEIVKDIPVWMSYLLAPSGIRFSLTGSEISIGRAHTRDGWIPTIDLSTEQYGDTVSRRHATLVRQGMQWLAQETAEGAANGTYLNGQRMTPGEPSALRDGDLFRLGWVELVFCQGQ